MSIRVTIKGESTTLNVSFEDAKEVVSNSVKAGNNLVAFIAPDIILCANLNDGLFIDNLEDFDEFGEKIDEECEVSPHHHKHEED